MSHTVSKGKIQKTLTIRAAWLKAVLQFGSPLERSIPFMRQEKAVYKEVLRQLGLFDQEYYDEEFARSTEQVKRKQAGKAA